MTKIHMLLPLDEWVERPRLKPRKKPPEGMVAREEDLKRFWEKVDVRTPDECWEWKGATSVGYGRFQMLRTVMIATHFSLYAHGVKIPAGHEVCHTCDNPPCVNPNHLFVGTRSDNMQDCLKKGRLVKAGCVSDEMIPLIRGTDEPAWSLAGKLNVSIESIRRVRYFRGRYRNL